MEDEKLPVGRYVTPHGVEVVGLDDFQVRASSRAAWQRQAVLDDRLALRLKGMHVVAAFSYPAVAASAVRGSTMDLFGPAPDDYPHHAKPDK